jgi:RNA polymerase sigma-54 factor
MPPGWLGQAHGIGAGRVMRQIQRQAQARQLAMTQSMRASLALLSMSPQEVMKAVRREQSRNGFLRSAPNASLDGGAGMVRAECAQRESATDDLLRQVALIRLSPRQALLAQDLVHSLDDRGFLPDGPRQTAGHLACSEAELDALLPILREGVDPPGLFAWSLADSFRLQLQARNRFDPLIERLLGRLDLIALQDIDAICEACQVDREDAVEMLDDIRALTPTPLGYQAEESPPSGEPELIILADPGGACTASLNEGALPRLLTDDALFSATMAVETDAHARSYYRDCYRGAANIVQALQKRANTLLAAGQVIAYRQHKFIQTGRTRDRLPLTMSQLAQAVGVNKSTISRALANCRVRTGLGVLPAARFLARPLSDRAPDRTRDQVMQRLQLLIRSEDPRTPLSDEALALQLGKVRLSVSRRTVAKYRQTLEIPGAYDRRRGGPT